MDDCNDRTGWTKQDYPTLTAELSVDNNDYFKIHATAGTGSVYWAKTFSTLESNIYKKFMLRYKTSNLSIKAKVRLGFVVGEQFILPESSSLTWTHISDNITQNKQINRIDIYATSAPGDVYYDFNLLYEGDFQFPSAESVRLDLPPPRVVDIPIPFKDGIVPQNFGSEMVPINIRGDMDLGSWGTPSGQNFYQIWHKQSSELWQWFESPEHGVKFKVRPSQPSYVVAEKGKLSFDLNFKEYRLGNANRETYRERFGLV